MTIMAPSGTAFIPIPGLTTDKIRQSMQDASTTVERAEAIVARVQRHILRCDVLLRRMRVLAELRRAR